MKKLIALFFALTCVLDLVGCSNQPYESIHTYVGNMKTYYKMADGTWQTEGNTYKYKLEITGRMPNAAVDTTFVFLSNLESIPFEQAWKAAGYSSSTDDYFAVEDAVLVEMRAE